MKTKDIFFDILIKTSLESIRIVPVYLGSGNWNQNLKVLQEFIENNYSDRLVVIGDLNGRTKAGQVLDDEFEKLKKYRISEDHTINSNGNKLIEFFNQLSLVILNGRFFGDYEGKLTFDGVMAKSVIDYCVTTKVAIDFITKFEVGESSHSDHCPIVLSLRIPQGNQKI